jgi:hypothetical protein
MFAKNELKALGEKVDLWFPRGIGQKVKRSSSGDNLPNRFSGFGCSMDGHSILLSVQLA